MKSLSLVMLLTMFTSIGSNSTEIKKMQETSYCYYHTWDDGNLIVSQVFSTELDEKWKLQKKYSRIDYPEGNLDFYTEKWSFGMYDSKTKAYNSRKRWIEETKEKGYKIFYVDIYLHFR